MRLVITLAIVLSLVSVASAQLSMTGVGGGFGGAAVGCSNSADFSNGCNSGIFAVTLQH